MARIGVYGGAFNPIHNTHIEIADAAQKQFNLDKVFFVVTGQPPHKRTIDAISFDNRADMVELAISDNNGFAIDKREAYHSGKSYSYLTLQEYTTEYANDEIFFIMGSDSLLMFKSWVHPEIISELATILIAPRIGDDLITITSTIEEYRKLFKGDFQLINYAANSISSTDIRSGFYFDDAIKSRVDARVCDYIISHDLYDTSYDYNTVIQLLSEMKKALKNSRYIHTIGVANTAYSLALRWDYPEYNAMVAGALHDCAKCLSDSDRISIAKKNNIPISDIEYKFPQLLHGKVGAHLAQKKYDITNEQILHSIAIHTTGDTNMNLLDKIVYIADYIEPGRNKQPRLDIIRKMAYIDIDECLFMILEDSVCYLSDRPDLIDPTTLKAYEYYKTERS